MKSLVAFVGFKGCGKNTAAEALYPYGFIPISFADALKDALASIFCWDRALLEGNTTEGRLWREQVDVWWAERLGVPNFTPRFAMTNFGTQVMRQHFHKEIWVANVERRMTLVDTSVALIDVRFPNEYQLARKYGGRVYRIMRGVDPPWTENAIRALKGSETDQSIMKYLNIHETEWAWLGCEVDAVIINNGTSDEFQEKIKSLIL